MQKASERLAKLLELNVPEAQAQDLVKSAITAGDLEDDLQAAATIDTSKFEKILEQLRKSQEVTAEEKLSKSAVQDVRDDLPTKDVKRMLDAVVASQDVATEKLAKAMIHVGELISELSTALASIDRRQGEISKSLTDSTPAPAPKSVQGTLAAVPSPLDSADRAAKFEETISLRKSVVDSIRGELDKDGLSAARIDVLTSALREIGYSSDPRAVAARAGITL